jgi:cysteinyl-tRNA synthetase
VAWESPWGRGRPGWHIECTAMSTALLGDQIDIHCGGVDNIFPHHEAEIAQSEGVTGKKFVRYWLHCAHLLVDGQKMSKSLGNFYTLPDLLKKGYTGPEIRYALMRVHYRAPLNFTWEGMEEARQALARINEWLLRLRETAAKKIDKGKNTTEPGQQFEEALDDDLNISAALGFLFESIRETNRAMDQNEMDDAAANAWLRWWEHVNRVLNLPVGVQLRASLGMKGELQAVHIPAEIADLMRQRVQARLAKDFKKSDELRNELSARGWEVRDIKDGQEIIRRAGG